VLSGLACLLLILVATWMLWPDSGGKGNADVAGETNHVTPVTPAPAPNQPDIVFQDFEGGTYGDWTVKGISFGEKPHSPDDAPKALNALNPNFNGLRVADSFFAKNHVASDSFTGSLSSPSFTIERNFVNFWLAGGEQDTAQAVLLIDGTIQRTMHGQGKGWVLQPVAWNVREFVGKNATIEIIDQSQKPNSHISVDSFVFSNEDHTESAWAKISQSLQSSAKEWNGRKYSFGNVSARFNEATEFAHLLGARLLCTESGEEADFIASQINSDVWLGVSNQTGANAGRWIDGSGNICIHGQWQDGAPEFFHSQVAKLTRNGFWKDDVYTSLNHYVIEFGPPQVPTGFVLSKSSENRAAAELIQRKGGGFGIVTNDRLIWITATTPLPQDDFELRDVRFPKGTTLTTEEVEQFKGLEGITRLDLAECDDSVLEILKHVPLIRRLEIKGGKYQWAALKYLPKQNSLRSVVLASVGITSEQLKPVFEAVAMQSFDLIGSGADPGLGELLQTQKHSLEFLGLNAVWGLGTEAINKIGNLSSVDNLVLWGTGTTDENLPAIGRLTKLKSLQLGANRQLTGKSLASLAPLIHLKDFSLWASGLDDSGLSNLPVLPSLRGIAIGDTKITDVGITRLLDLPDLQELSSNLTGVSDAGLEKLKAHPSLTKIDAIGTRITKAAMDDFAADRPGFRTDLTVENAYVAYKPLQDVGKTLELAAMNPAYLDALQKKIEQDKSEIANRKLGHAVVGRVQLEGEDDPETVMSQMVIRPGGFFSDAVADLVRPVGFRKVGYRPFNLVIPPGIQPDINGLFDVGTIVMEKVPGSELRKVSGTISLEGGGSVQDVSVKLVVKNGPINTPSNGTEPGATKFTPTPAVVDANGHFEARELSSGEYYVLITKTGFVSTYPTVQVNATSDVEVPPIELKRESRVSIEFVQSSMLANEFGQNAIESSEILSGQGWNLGKDRFGDGLRFRQDGTTVQFVGTYSTSRLADLGAGQLKDFLKIDPQQNGQYPNSVPLVSGHVYLLNQPNWSHRVLFRIGVAEPLDQSVIDERRMQFLDDPELKDFKDSIDNKDYRDNFLAALKILFDDSNAAGLIDPETYLLVGRVTVPNESQLRWVVSPVMPLKGGYFAATLRRSEGASLPFYAPKSRPLTIPLNCPSGKHVLVAGTHPMSAATAEDMVPIRMRLVDAQKQPLQVAQCWTLVQYTHVMQGGKYFNAVTSVLQRLQTVHPWNDRTLLSFPSDRILNGEQANVQMDAGGNVSFSLSPGSYSLKVFGPGLINASLKIAPTAFQATSPIDIGDVVLHQRMSCQLNEICSADGRFDDHDATSSIVVPFEGLGGISPETTKQKGLSRSLELHQVEGRIILERGLAEVQQIAVLGKDSISSYRASDVSRIQWRTLPEFLHSAATSFSPGTEQDSPDSKLPQGIRRMHASRHAGFLALKPDTVYAIKLSSSTNDTTLPQWALFSISNIATEREGRIRQFGPAYEKLESEIKHFGGSVSVSTFGTSPEPALTVSLRRSDDKQNASQRSAASESLMQTIAELTSPVDLVLMGEKEDYSDKAIAKIAQMKNLRLLNVDFECDVLNDSVCQKLASYGNLRTVVIRSSKITDAGLTAFAKLKNLENLTVSQAVISDAGIMSLKEHPTLTTIQLGNCTRVTESGLATFATLKMLKRLTVYDVNSNTTGIQKLRKERPDMIIGITGRTPWLSHQDFKTEFDANRLTNTRVTDVFMKYDKDANQLMYAAEWAPSDGSMYWLNFGITDEQLESEKAKHAAEGYTLTQVRSASFNGKRNIALWTKEPNRPPATVQPSNNPSAGH